MAFREIIRNGRVVTENQVLQCDIGILEDGTIGALGNLAGLENGAHLTDAKGAVIFPGGVDGHVHLDYHMGSISTTDDFETGSKAALAGGTTTIIDFCQPEAGEDALDAIDRRMKQAEKSLADYTFHFIFTEEYEKQLEQTEQILSRGIGSFKAYTTYDQLTLNAGGLYRIMKEIGGRATLMVHAEDHELISALEKEHENPDLENLFYTRPNLAEELCVRELAAMQKATGTKVCIAHTSTQEVMELKKREKQQGNAFYVETCPHYLWLTKDIYSRPEGKLYAMNPPLKSEADRDALWKGVMEENVDFISTDHCPFTRKQKESGTDYRSMACGIGGLQTRMNFMFSEAVVKRGMSYTDFAKITATNCAKIYGLYPKKGCISVGSDADLVFMRPEEVWIYQKADFVGKSDYDMLEDTQLHGKITAVYRRGQLVSDGRRVYPSAGMFVKVPT